MEPEKTDVNSQIVPLMLALSQYEPEKREAAPVNSYRMSNPARQQD